MWLPYPIALNIQKSMQIQRQVKEFLRRTNIRPKKHLGQNFLIDENILNKIIAVSGLTEDDLAVEIGAGLGHLTVKLAEVVQKVTSLELDDRLFAELQQISTEYANVELIHADVLKFDLSTLFQTFQRNRTKVVANLPYYITTPILLKLLKLRSSIQTCVLMIQEEVARRIIAPPNNKTYGSLTILVNYHAEPEIALKVPATCFYPVPKVNSALLLLKMRESPKVQVADEKLFFQIVRSAFMYRRKTLKNALKMSGLALSTDAVNAAFELLGIEPNRRGETLSIEEFASLADCFS